MRTRSALATLAATLVLAAAAGPASAARLEFGRPEGGFAIKWSQLRFAFIFNGMASVVRCPVTMAGSFHSRTFAKVVRALVGYVTSANVAEGACVGGIGREGEVPYPFTMQALPATLPWHLEYSAFLGTLPSIFGAKVRLVGTSIQVNEGMLRRTCLYRATVENSIGLTFDRETRGVVRTASMEGESIPFNSGSAFCGRENANIFEGSGAATQLSGANLTLTLV